ncbi:16S rRNA (cytosine(1402)-N(4))-methyltransferase RsmH [bacterium]|nr:16S rRNA (cytosine(1402)-N(4))-methyltransferase RsmH [bacterium]
MITTPNDAYHKPVLMREVLDALQPGDGKLFLDVTFGGGGHTRALLESNPNCRVIALDWDTKAIDLNAPPLKELFGERFTILWGNFSNLYKIVKKEKIGPFDGILADFGTSQFQIHQRPGFSFSKDSPLDMRMSPAHQLTTAADIIANYSEKDLADLFFTYGEERSSRQIAKAIVTARTERTIRTTTDLVQVIEKLFPVKAFKAARGIHPATKIFQALRIAVNDELNNIQSFLSTALGLLKPGGRLACISFHSLEDRIVKQFFLKHQDKLEILTPKPVTAQDDELVANASSRSAKLRVAQYL